LEVGRKGAEKKTGRWGFQKITAKKGWEREEGGFPTEKI